MSWFTIIVVLLVVLIIAVIVVNAFQQHQEREEAEKRTEVAKQKSIIDETENCILGASQLPVSQKLIFILHQRIHNALKLMYELNPTTIEIKNRIKQADERVNSINVEEPPPPEDNLQMPDNDKQIIQYIQAVKKLRVLLRSEHSKGKVDSQTFMIEDKRLDKLQLRINVETLTKRGATALQGNMLGSARQYFEKAVAALDAQPQPDDYSRNKKAELEQRLKVIQDNLANVNAKDREKRQEEERDELDELFAPKKKW